MSVGLSQYTAILQIQFLFVNINTINKSDKNLVNGHIFKLKLLAQT